MKAKTTKVAIPRGWRKLRVGALLRTTDKFDSGWGWFNTSNAGKRIGATGTLDCYIRKSTARPRSRKVGGMKK